MVLIAAFMAACLLPCVIQVSAIPAQLGKRNSSSILDLTVEDILNAPAIVSPFDDPAFKPINAGSNGTLVTALPAFASPVNNLAPIIASISAVAATAAATAAGGAPAVIPTATPTAIPTATPKIRRDLSKRTVPPAPLQYFDIDCNYNPTFPTVNYNIWVAAITKACREWFDPLGPPYTSPLVYLYEGSHSHVTAGPVTHQFQFDYTVRTDTSVPYDSWHAYTANRCMADLEAYTFAALAPNAAGLMTAFGLCFDTSGFSTEPDDNSPIWFSVTSPPV